MPGFSCLTKVRSWPIAARRDRALSTRTRHSGFPKAASETKTSYVIDHVKSHCAAAQTEGRGKG